MQRWKHRVLVTKRMLVHCTEYVRSLWELRMQVSGAHSGGEWGASAEALLVTLKEAQIITLKTLWIFSPYHIGAVHL